MKKDFGITGKLLFSVLSLMIITTILVSVYGYVRQKKIINELMYYTAETSLTEILDRVAKADLAVQKMENALNRNYLRIAKSVSRLIENNPNVIKPKNISNLAKEIGVDEIHVTDGKGVLRWGNIEAFYGFDFNTSEQTKPFIAGLNNKNFELAQKPSIRGADKTLFQYIGVARQDKAGVVQIGVQPKELQDLTNKSKIETVLQDTKIGEDGFSMMIDSSGKILAHKDESKIGEQLNTEWVNNLMSNSGDFLSKNEDNKEVLIYFKEYKENKVLAVLPTHTYKKPLNELRNGLFFFLIFTISIIGVILTYVIRRIVINPIYKLREKFSEISSGEGDLTQRLDVVSRDEIGQLAVYFNEFISNLQQIIQEIIKLNKNMVNESNELVNISGQQSQNASGIHSEIISINEYAQQIEVNVQAIVLSTEEALSNVTTVAAASEEMSSNVKEVATAADKTANNVNNVSNEVSNMTQNIEKINDRVESVDVNITSTATAIEELSASISEISRNSSKAHELSLTANETSSTGNAIMITLKETAQEIGKIVRVISDIADQTNMLALNATIEAASAGDAGKGFAVVANEVKELAKQTAEATAQIAQQIENVQTAADNSANSISHIGTIIHELNEINTTIASAIQEQSITTNEIAHTMEKVVAQTKQVQEFTSDVDSMAKDVKSNTITSAELVENIARSSQESAFASNEVAQNSNKASQDVHNISENTNEIANGVRDIAGRIEMLNLSAETANNSADDTRTSAEKMSEITAQLEQLIGKFKV